jgi:hypothetical protein
LIFLEFFAHLLLNFIVIPFVFILWTCILAHTSYYRIGCSSQEKPFQIVPIQFF